jgi:membrane-bound lytic murein transglycosylase MltF
MRKEAQKRGLDPDEWFDSVEVVVAEKVGIETTTYVRNIFKYHTAYTLHLETVEEQRKARDEVAPAA